MQWQACSDLYICGVRGSSELRKYQISHSEIPSGDVKSGKSHLEIRGFEKHIENGESDVTNRKSNLVGKDVLFFFYFLIVLLDICR